MIELNYAEEDHDHGTRFRMFYIDPSLARDVPEYSSLKGDPLWVADSTWAPLGSALKLALIMRNYQPVWLPGDPKIGLS